MGYNHLFFCLFIISDLIGKSCDCTNFVQFGVDISSLFLSLSLSLSHTHTHININGFANNIPWWIDGAINLNVNCRFKFEIWKMSYFLHSPFVSFPFSIFSFSHSPFITLTLFLHTISSCFRITFFPFHAVLIFRTLCCAGGNKISPVMAYYKFML